MLKVILGAIVLLPLAAVAVASFAVALFVWIVWKAAIEVLKESISVYRLCKEGMDRSEVRGGVVKMHITKGKTAEQ